MSSNLIITILTILALIFIGLIFWTQSKRNKISESDQKRIRKHWNNLPLSPKDAILEADKILDEGLKLRGYKGSLGGKLKQAGPLFTNQNNVWSAHKLRNRIAHELSITISEGESKRALGQFKQALKDLGFKL
jgi:hypothetical protein